MADLELDPYKQEIADLYTRRSSTYDNSEWHLHIAHRLVEYGQVNSEQQVLDIATGTGMVALKAAEIVGTKGKVVGVDISIGMLDQALSMKHAPARLRQIFASKTLKSFKFVSIQDQAAGLSIISTNLVFEEYGEEILKLFDFRLANESSHGDPEVSGTPDSDWRVINWGLY
jgi:SAM-dependent methyltransferase